MAMVPPLLFLQLQRPARGLVQVDSGGVVRERLFRFLRTLLLHFKQRFCGAGIFCSYIHFRAATRVSGGGKRLSGRSSAAYRCVLPFSATRTPLGVVWCCPPPISATNCSNSALLLGRSVNGCGSFGL